MATEQVQVDNPVDLGERQSLLEDAFTPEQIAALRANGGLAAADDGGGAKTSAGNIADYMSLKVAFGRLTESPTNWHQAAVYALSSTAPEDELLRRRSPVSLAISVVIVLLQLLTIVAVLMAAVFPPCHDNNSDCPHDGMFCKASGNGLEAFQGSRCGTCGNYGPMGYEYDESTGKMYNQMMIDGSTKDPEFAGFNMTHVHMVCADPSLSVGLKSYIPAARCYDDISNPVSKRFEDRFEEILCSGADKLGEPSPNYEGWVELWCSACVVPDGTGGDTVPHVTSHDIQINNIEKMRRSDWVVYFFCSVLVALTIVGEVKDIQAGDDIPKLSRFVLTGTLLARRWTFMPLLMILVVALVTSQGGSALDICFNTIAILFVCEIDNVAYRYGIPEGMRARVETHGRCELTTAQAAALWRSKLVHVVCIPVATLTSTKVVEVYGTFGYILNIIALTIAALFEEFGGDESTEAEMVNAFGRGGTTRRRLFDVACSLIVGLVLIILSFMCAMAIDFGEGSK